MLGCQYGLTQYIVAVYVFTIDSLRLVLAKSCIVTCFRQHPVLTFPIMQGAVVYRVKRVNWLRGLVESDVGIAGDGSKEARLASR